MATLYVAFKGEGNSSNKIVRNLSGDTLFLTNSYDGLKRDIESIASASDLNLPQYDLIYMFGVDKTLKGNIRIEHAALKDGEYLYSNLDLSLIAARLNKNGITAHIGSTPIRSLCNEAYWYMLKKYDCRAVFFHVPSVKYITETFLERVKAAL